MCWVWLQHADDEVVREASNEVLAPAALVRTLGRGGRAKVRPATGSTSPV
jgi:hypothetical protein